MFSIRLVNKGFVANEMVQVQVPAVKHDDLSLILRTTLRQGETSSNKLFSDRHMGAITCDHTLYHTNTQNDKFG